MNCSYLFNKLADVYRYIMHHETTFFMHVMYTVLNPPPCENLDQQSQHLSSSRLDSIHQLNITDDIYNVFL
jgi:hypothetical protein